MRILALLLLLAACTVPPPDAYLDGSANSDQVVDLGSSTDGQACVQNAASTAAEIYCGGDKQPTARVRTAGPATADTLAGFATAGGWRDRLDANYACPQPQPARFGDAAALTMRCTRRVGGWPYFAFVQLADGQAWEADGQEVALPAIQHSIAVMTHREQPKIVSSAAVKADQAQRAASGTVGQGGVREYDSLMLKGTDANLADELAKAEASFRAALTLAEKQFGPDSPNVADAAMHVALQMSNQGRFSEADAMFRRAEQLASRPVDDRTLMPRMLQYEGLNLYNEHKLEAALDKLRAAETGYLKVIPPERLHAGAASVNRATDFDRLLSSAPQLEVSAALGGVVEARRFVGVVLRDLGRPAESRVALQSALDTARDAGIEQSRLTARLYRSSAMTAEEAGDITSATSELRASSGAFSQAFPSSRPAALVGLLQADGLMRAGQRSAAVPVCRAAVKTLIEIKSAFEPKYMAPCLDAFASAAEAADTPAARQMLLREMFEASQVVQSSTTSQQIQQASARLAEGSKNSAAGQAIREEQDAAANLSQIQGRRAILAAQAEKTGVQAPASVSKALDDEERAAAATLAQKEEVLQLAAHGYNQLIQQATSAGDVLGTLKPGQAFAAITMSDTGGYTFLLHDGVVQSGRIKGGAASVNKLVARIRASMTEEVPPFDTAAAQELYSAIFDDVATEMDSVKTITVAPMGSLLAIPFELLLTGPGDPDKLAAAPWLVRKMPVEHIPSAANFAALGKLAGSLNDTRRPWFGFGDFRQVSAAQAQRSFPPASCGDAAALMAHLPPLSGAVKELTNARLVLAGDGQNTLLGPRFTAAAVESENLSDVRVLHFATHAITAADLPCESEPALITSAPGNAPDASGAFLTASDLARTKLDADLVILSACNSGGSDGQLTGGESLSTLARSFFFAGARSLMFTHWDVSDQAASFIVPETLRQAYMTDPADFAGALREAQLYILDRAGTDFPASWAHPFYWAPFALMGHSTSGTKLPAKTASNP